MRFHHNDVVKLVDIPWYICGIEKEGLRVTDDGKLSKALHSQQFGSKLTNPYITTDFSEAQPELITSTFSSTEAAIAELADIHSFLLSNMEGEYLWPTSMPCRLPSDETIQIADFGTAFLGRIKQLYRKGLHYRYGSSMQTISGVHFNFSVTRSFWQRLAFLRKEEYSRDFVDSRYFDLIRNYRRYAFVIHYLFGASPVFDDSFLGNSRLAKQEDYQACRENTWLSLGATSLRMTDIGYMSKMQNNMRLCFDCLDDYLKSMRMSLEIKVEEFRKIGVRSADGQYLQLNDNLLQIENEYYTQIRPKRNSTEKLRPIQALRKEGIEYIEIRNLDINPFCQYGIDTATADFMVVFLLWCLLEDSPLISEQECDIIQQNLTNTSRFGRLKETRVNYEDSHISPSQASIRVLNKVFDLASILDATGQSQYKQAVLKFQKQLDNQTTLSQVIETQQLESSQGFVSLAFAKAKKYKQASPELKKERQAYFTDIAYRSIEEQKQQEQCDERSKQTFDEFIENFLHI